MKNNFRLLDNHLGLLLVLILITNASRVYSQVWQEKNGIDLPQPISQTPVDRSKGNSFPGPSGFYYGLGETTYNLLPPSYYTDWYKFDLDSNLWKPLPDCPFAERGYGYQFYLNQNGFIVGGKDETNCYNDCWQFDSTNFSWSQKASFPRAVVNGGSNFSLNGLGYIVSPDTSCSGLQNHEVWEFNPVLNQWIQKNNFPASSYSSNAVFVVGNDVYVIDKGNSVTDSSKVWKYDANTDIWIQCASAPGLPTKFGAFGKNGKGYASLNTGFFSYDILLDTWVQKNSLVGMNAFQTISSMGEIYALHGKEVMRYDDSLDSWISIYSNNTHPALNANFFWNDCIYFTTRKYYPNTDQWIVDSTFHNCTEFQIIDSNLYAFRNGIFQKYTFQNSSWSAVAAYPGAQIPAVCFSANGKIYMGVSSSDNDFWQFDPANNQWTLMANFPGQFRSNAGEFRFGDSLYLVGGMDPVSWSGLTDVWKYDIVQNQWEQKASYPDTGIINGVCTYTSKRGYIGFGADNAVGLDLNNWLFEYNPSLDSWDTINSPLNSRRGAVSFTYNDLVYVASGQHYVIHPDPLILDDNWVLFESRLLELNVPSSLCVNSLPILFEGGYPAGGTYSGTGVVNGIFDPAISGVGTHVITYAYSFSDSIYNVTDTIHVFPQPLLDLGGDTIVCNSPSFSIDAGSIYNTYNWSTGSTVSTAQIDTIGVGLGLQLVWLQVSNSYGCTAQDTIQVTFDVCSSIDEWIVKPMIFPNPCNGTLKVSLTRPSYVTVYNSQLSTIKKLYFNVGEAIINFERTGIYFIKFENKYRSSIHKVIVSSNN